MLFSGPGRYKLEIATEISSVARLVIRSLHTLYKLKTELTVRDAACSIKPQLASITAPSQQYSSQRCPIWEFSQKARRLKWEVSSDLVEKPSAARSYYGSGFIAEAAWLRVTIEELADGLVQLMADS